MKLLIYGFTWWLAHAEALVKDACQGGETAFRYFEQEIDACQGEYGKYVLYY